MPVTSKTWWDILLKISRCFFPLVKLLRLCNKKLPVMDKLYNFVRQTDEHIRRSIADLNEIGVSLEEKHESVPWVKVATKSNASHSGDRRVVGEYLMCSKLFIYFQKHTELFIFYFYFKRNQMMMTPTTTTVTHRHAATTPTVVMRRAWGIWRMGATRKETMIWKKIASWFVRLRRAVFVEGPYKRTTSERVGATGIDAIP